MSTIYKFIDVVLQFYCLAIKKKLITMRYVHLSLSITFIRVDVILVYEPFAYAAEKICMRRT